MSIVNNVKRTGDTMGIKALAATNGGPLLHQRQRRMDIVPAWHSLAYSQQQVSCNLNVEECRRPSRYVPYIRTFVPYIRTFGAPDQGQMLDV
jgi:hypothetical protein